METVRSKDVSKIYAISGNGGISDIAECVEIDTGNIGNLVDSLKAKALTLLSVGFETFLARGLSMLLKKGYTDIWSKEKWGL